MNIELVTAKQFQLASLLIHSSETRNQNQMPELTKAIVFIPFFFFT